MAPSTSTSPKNGLQVARGMSAYAKNPRELDVPISEGMLILHSNLYQSFINYSLQKTGLNLLGRQRRTLCDVVITGYYDGTLCGCPHTESPSVLIWEVS